MRRLLFYLIFSENKQEICSKSREKVNFKKNLEHAKEDNQDLLGKGKLIGNTQI
jgi:hypothetical protein